MIKTRAGRARAEVEVLSAALANRRPDEFCSLLYEEVKRQGVEAVAKRAGMTRRTLHAALNSAKNPTLASLFAITEALGLELSIK